MAVDVVLVDAAQRASLAREDGLTEADGATGAGASTLSGQAGGAVLVGRPAPGQTAEIQSLPGRTYVLDFPPATAQVAVDDPDFVMSFDDDGDGVTDSRIIFRDMVQAAASDAVPTFQIAGISIAADILLEQAVALSGQHPGLDEVAAGPEVTSGGVSVYSDDLGSLLELLAAQGVIPPVELQFGLIDVEAAPCCRTSRHPRC